MQSLVGGETVDVLDCKWMCPYSQLNEAYKDINYSTEVLAQTL